MVEQVNDEENVDDPHNSEEPPVEEEASSSKEKGLTGKDAGRRIDWGSSAPYISLQVAAVRHVEPRRDKNFKQGR